MQANESLSQRSVPGFRTVGVACGIKKENALDLALVVSDTPCHTAAVFTTNRVKAAPVLYDQEILRRNPEAIRAVVINSGGANACTGTEGMDDARSTATRAASILGCSPDDILVMSTGVIGQRLPMDKIEAGIAMAANALSPDGWEQASHAIMTTDTRAKLHLSSVDVKGQTLSFAGMAKGAGMIHINMATMLSLVVTDARIATSLLRRALSEVVEDTFNATTIDGDTSTNDTLLLLANGQGPQISEEDDSYGAFVQGLRALCGDLARKIARDGEGATKFVSILVRGAPDRKAAKQVAKAIAHSPLVKTAIYGTDANWGRVMAAAGYSGVPIEPENLSLWFSRGEYLDGSLAYPSGADVEPQIVSDAPLHVHLVRGGRPYDVDEERALEVLQGNDVAITLDLGMGQASSLIWTCDLSHDYVTINGHYRT